MMANRDGAERQLHRGRKQRNEFCRTGRLVTMDESNASHEITEVIDVLDVERPVEAKVAHDPGIAPGATTLSPHISMTDLPATGG